MRVIEASTIEETICRLFKECNYFIGDDIKAALLKAKESEESQTAKNVLEQIIENDNIASREEIPICQDTGMAVVFVEYGDKVVINGDFESAVNEGVRRAYSEGYLRKSVVDDPVYERKNTKDNTPAIIHTKIVSGERLRFTVGGKGFGSENMSQIKMLSPSYGAEGIVDFVVEAVKNAGPNPCPPCVIGVGIGGTFESCACLAKKATFRSIDNSHPDERYAALENEMLEEINKLNIGPAGLGGKCSALKVNIETLPTHIAGMPVAVNICCHAARHKSAVI